MLRDLSQFFAWLLLVLMPLQGLAAANMFLCNSMVQVQVSEHQSVNKPCHMVSMEMASMTKAQDNCKHQTACKNSCATLCASLGSMTALNQTVPILPVLTASQVVAAYNNSYISYLPTNLQRPPILLT